jgi:hypothetical protein
LPQRSQGIVENYLFDLNLETLLEESASEKIFIWMRSKEDGKIDSFEVEKDNLKAALISSASGASLYFRR